MRYQTEVDRVKGKENTKVISQREEEIEVQEVEIHQKVVPCRKDLTAMIQRLVMEVTIHLIG